MASAAPKETVGNYVIERALARGSMGHVYVAHHTLTHARVALKVLRLELASDAMAEERFLREVRAAAHIGHEGIVRVHDAGKSPDGRLFLAMELLEGETLEQRLRRDPGERANAMQWVQAMLEPLAAAHAQGFVHRDLKPANVFITRATAEAPERVKLLDFGLARDLSEKAATATGIALGTPYYMSPEQATEPRKVAAPSDVWSIGVMMYEVCCGAMPFDGETLHAVVIAASTAPHAPAAERAPTLDARLTRLIDTCLSKDPAARPRDAGALRDELAALLDDDAVRAQLAAPVATTARRHQDGSRASRGSRAEDSRMPFAETAFSLPPLHESSGSRRAADTAAIDAPKLNESAREKRDGGSLGPWLLSLALLVLAAGAFAWLILREPPPSAADDVGAGANAAPTITGDLNAPKAPGPGKRPLGRDAGKPTRDGGAPLPLVPAADGGKHALPGIAPGEPPPPNADDLPAPEAPTPAPAEARDASVPTTTRVEPAPAHAEPTP